MAELAGPAGPVREKDRFLSLDVLRGIALLGILLLNIAGMGLAGAYFDPTIQGGANGLNLTAWYFNNTFVEGTMRTIFSVLFGAGVILLTGRAEKRGAGIALADIYFRRTIWLVAFGMVNAYLLLWMGDILFYYGLVGLFLFSVRKVHPKWLLAGSLAAFLTIFAINNHKYHDAVEVHEKYLAVQAVEEAGGTLSEEQQADVEAWQAIRASWLPTPEQVEEKTEARRAGYVEAFKSNAEEVFYFHTVLLYEFFILDALAAMLLGMALFKWGFLTVERKTRDYLAMMIAGYGIGYFVNAHESASYMNSGFDLVVFYENMQTYDLGRITMAIGHLGLFLLFIRSGILGWLQRSLAAVGRMALTNYISHSVFAAVIFTGFGLFGQLERYQLYYVVFAIWVFQLITSPLWLKYFRFGPLEWVWRSLTYLKRQPLRRRPAKP